MPDIPFAPFDKLGANGNLDTIFRKSRNFWPDFGWNQTDGPRSGP
jgi:hypothetical protein